MIKTFAETGDLTDLCLKEILETDKYDEELFYYADKIRRSIYGNDVYIRGLIEISNYCKNNCFYCGIRCENKLVTRYRLTKKEILSCCKKGYKLGFRTFVLQGGEDTFFSDEYLCEIIKEIKSLFPDCAITLSLGERSYDSYALLKKAGADRYLLRHETADIEHYKKLHPENLDLYNRKKCLFDLKSLGFHTGSGFMVGSPFQTTENIIKDLRFLQELQPDMIGIGPFIHHSDTPFKDYENGSLKLTLRLISILRIMFPYALIPATTALGTLEKGGREMGIKAGANVVMPNLSPIDAKKLYSLYNNKLTKGAENANQLNLLKKSMKKIGYRVVTDIGNPKTKKGECNENL